MLIINNRVDPPQGGADTAGLGGVGGPYRLDAGHDVHQVSQVDKDAVPEEVSCLVAYTAFLARLPSLRVFMSRQLCPLVLF